jgi:hypothetical protein
MRAMGSKTALGETAAPNVVGLLVYGAGAAVGGGVGSVVPTGTHLGLVFQAFELRRQRTSRHRCLRG